MFVLINLCDTITIPPSELPSNYSSKPFKAILLDQIDAKYCNKILHQQGLCIKTFDILKMNDPHVLYAYSGDISIKVEFRMVVFRPFIGEILLGKIRKNRLEGIDISIGGFFEDCFVPSELLPENSFFNTDEQVWVWKVDDMELFLDNGEEVRFMVANEYFNERKLTGLNTQQQHDEKPLYNILGSMTSSGLGCLSWWNESNGQDNQEDA